jgi:hypothetical protein
MRLTSLLCVLVLWLSFATNVVGFVVFSHVSPHGPRRSGSVQRAKTKKAANHISTVRVGGSLLIENCTPPIPTVSTLSPLVSPPVFPTVSPTALVSLTTGTAAPSTAPSTALPTYYFAKKSEAFLLMGSSTLSSTFRPAEFPAILCPTSRCINVTMAYVDQHIWAATHNDMEMYGRNTYSQECNVISTDSMWARRGGGGDTGSNGNSPHTNHSINKLNTVPVQLPARITNSTNDTVLQATDNPTPATTHSSSSKVEDGQIVSSTLGLREIVVLLLLSAGVVLVLLARGGLRPSTITSTPPVSDDILKLAKHVESGSTNHLGSYTCDSSAGGVVPSPATCDILSLATHIESSEGGVPMRRAYSNQCQNKKYELRKALYA